MGLAKTWGVSYRAVLRFVRDDPQRNELYEQSLKDREEWFIESIKQEITRIGFTDVRLLFDDDGKVKPVSEWPDDLGAAVGALEVIETFESDGDGGKTWTGYNKKIKLHDKLKALELLGKTLAMFKDRVEHDVGGKLEDLLTRSRAP